MSIATKAPRKASRLNGTYDESIEIIEKNVIGLYITGFRIIGEDTDFWEKILK